MANVKISQLPSLSTMTDLAQIPVVAGGTTYQITGSNLSSYFSTSAAGSKIVNGSTEANIGTSGGNANISVGGIANVAVFTQSGVTVSGILSAPTLTTNNIRSDDSSFVNIEDGVNVTGAVIAAGNVVGDYFIGNGSQLTGLAPTYGNANVVANLAALGTNPVSTTGNITGGNIAAAEANVTDVIAYNVSTVNIFARDSSGINLGANGFNNLVVEETRVLVQNVPLSVAGNITAGNLDATNLVINSITSDDSSFVTIEDGVNVNGTISAIGNISTDTNVVVTPAVGTLVLGNATATNSPGLSSTTSLTLTANRAGTAKSMELGNDGNLSVPGAVYTTANITGGNISTAGYIGANTIGVSYSVAARTVVTDPVSFGDLTAAFGARAFINDGNLVAVGNFGAQVSGGGGNSVPIWSDGANWYIG